MTIPSREFRSRLDSTMKRVDGEGLDSLVIWSLEDTKYLSNYHPILNESALVLPKGQEPVLLIDDEDDLIRARTVTQLAKVIVSQDLGRGVVETLGGTCEGRLGVTGWNRFPVPAYLAMKERLRAEIAPSRIVEEQRRVKSRNEIALLEEAARISDLGMETAVEACLAKRSSELEMAAAAEGAMRAAGAESLSFPTNLGVGVRTTLISPMPSQVRPKEGDLALIDLGAKYEGYCGDMSRTKGVGRVGEKQKELFDAIAEIHAKAIAAVRPGVKTSRVHDVAREVAEELGFGEPYHYMTGHAIGLGEHERPYLYHDDVVELRPNMIVTIEPGMYIPKLGGIRIEDMVLVTESGSRILTSADRGLN